MTRKTQSSTAQVKIKGGLEPWQLRLVETAADHLVAGDISLLDVATTCKLSTRKFGEDRSNSDQMAP
jgi:hypothetical protein